MLRANELNTSPVEFMLWDKDLCQYATMDEARNFCHIDNFPFGADDAFWLQCYGRFKKLAYVGMEDKNGHPIYEGHIVRVKYKNLGVKYDFTGVVGFEKASFVIVESDYDTSQLSAFDFSDLEIIGNIFQNPDLLEPRP